MKHKVQSMIEALEDGALSDEEWSKKAESPVLQEYWAGRAAGIRMAVSVAEILFKKELKK